QHVTGGVKGGVVWASLHTSGDGAFTTSSDAGGAVGGFIAFDLGPQVRLETDLLWAGARFTVTSGPAPIAVSSRSIQLPVLFHVRFPSQRPTQAFVVAGPQFTMIGKITQSASGVVIDVSDAVKNADVGAAFGAGLERRTGAGALSVEARTTIGMRNLS